MKIGFYPKLAMDGLRKNRRMTLPYLLTSIGMVMMFYIVAFLHDSQLIRKILGGTTLNVIMGFWNDRDRCVFRLVSLLYQFLFDASQTPRVWDV